MILTIEQACAGVERVRKVLFNGNGNNHSGTALACARAGNVIGGGDRCETGSYQTM